MNCERQGPINFKSCRITSFCNKGNPTGTPEALKNSFHSHLHQEPRIPVDNETKRLLIILRINKLQMQYVQLSFKDSASVH